MRRTQQPFNLNEDELPTFYVITVYDSRDEMNEHNNKSSTHHRQKLIFSANISLVMH